MTSWECGNPARFRILALHVLKCVPAASGEFDLPERFAPGMKFSTTALSIRQLFFALATFCVAICVSTAEGQQPEEFDGPVSQPRLYGNQGVSTELQKKIDECEQQLPVLMKKHSVPGISLALIEDRQLVWSRGYGVRCAGTEVGVVPETIMESCSMSKPFFSYVVLKLVEQEKFDLDRPLVEYLEKDYLQDDERHRAITARMVMSHTTGLPNWRKGGWQSNGKLSLAFEPGSSFRYSGEGFLMLQRAVEKATNSNLDTLSREMLIEPLGLENTRFVWDERFLIRATCGHKADGSVLDGRKYFRRANSAYTLYTSSEDYAKFLVEIMQADRSAAHSLSQEMCKQMLSPVSHRDDQSADWGLGWGLRSLGSRRQVYHSGSNGTGFRCYSEFFPDEGCGLVLMANSLSGAPVWRAVVDRWHEAADVEAASE